MRFLMLADIHANIEALEAVLEDAKPRQYDMVIFLGDAVGYGPDPGAVIDKLEELGARCILGNHEAMSMSGLDWKAWKNPFRVATIIGSGIGGLQTIEEEVKVLNTRGPSRVSPFLVPKMIVDSAAGDVSIMYGAKGPNYCITTACATGSHCIGAAFNHIRVGQCDVAITGAIPLSRRRRERSLVRKGSCVVGMLSTHVVGVACVCGRASIRCWWVGARPAVVAPTRWLSMWRTRFVGRTDISSGAHCVPPLVGLKVVRPRCAAGAPP